MPSPYQKASLKALMGLFLEGQGHPLPEHTQLKSPSSLSRFLNHYNWSTRGVIRTTREAILEQLQQHLPPAGSSLQVLIDLTTLDKCGQFRHLATPVENAEATEPWVRVLNGKRGLHVVMLYLGVGSWRIPWSFRIWRGKGYSSPAQLGRKLLSTLPMVLTQRYQVIVLADTEFGTVEFIDAVVERHWRPVVGMRGNRTLVDGRTLKELYRQGRRGQQVLISGIDVPMTVSWFWLKRADGKRELRFIASSYPYSGVYLVRLGRKRWAIEGFFKTIKHRFGLHRFGQGTRIGVYRWLILALIAFLLAHWSDQWAPHPTLDWKVACDLALALLFPGVIWAQLLRTLEFNADIAEYFGFQIILKSLPDCAYRERCKI
jgi:Transposase DDE domain